MTHFVPVQRSAKVRNAALAAMKLPTAAQPPEAGHDTSTSSVASCAPAGFGVFSVDQADPFHRSASVSDVVLPK
jgi:hypothetical protein